MAEPSGARQRLVAWGFVAVQAALLIVLFVVPRGPGWTVLRPMSWVGTVMVGVGALGVGVSALGLGRGLTASPLPNRAAQLRTGGLYGLVRHPIYTALLLLAAGQVVRSGGLPRLAAGIALTALLIAKARWEEARLSERFPDYPAYAKVTPRFLPDPRRLPRRFSEDGRSGYNRSPNRRGRDQ